jgi:uncharacterized protein (DUF2249 family)
MDTQPVEITARPAAAAAAVEAGCAGGCACGEGEAADVVLDVRTIPHAVRHAAVLGAVGAVPAGSSLVLVAPHDPQRVLAEIVAAHADAVTTYLERGPEVWRVRVARVA